MSFLKEIGKVQDDKTIIVRLIAQGAVCLQCDNKITDPKLAVLSEDKTALYCGAYCQQMFTED